MAEITFSLKKYNISLHSCMIFEYFGCMGARPGGLSHILSPRLGFLWFLRFDRREKVLPFWPKNDQKSFKNRSQTQQVFRSLFWSTLEPSWGRFGRILGAKMEPKLVQKRSQERSWHKNTRPCFDPQKPMVFAYFLPSGGSKIDQKSIKIASQSGLKLRCRKRRKNHPKWFQKWPNMEPNLAPLEDHLAPKSH